MLKSSSDENKFLCVCVLILVLIINFKRLNVLLYTLTVFDKKDIMSSVFVCSGIVLC